MHLHNIFIRHRHYCNVGAPLSPHRCIFNLKQNKGQLLYFYLNCKYYSPEKWRVSGKATSVNVIIFSFFIFTKTAVLYLYFNQTREAKALVRESCLRFAKQCMCASYILSNPALHSRYYLMIGQQINTTTLNETVRSKTNYRQHIHAFFFFL